MALPFARFCQLIDVVNRGKAKEQKFIHSQSVFIAWWVYSTIEKAEGSKHYSTSEFMEMYGLLSEEEKEQALEDRIQAHKDELEKAHNNARLAERIFTGQN